VSSRAATRTGPTNRPHDGRPKNRDPATEKSLMQTDARLPGVGQFLVTPPESPDEFSQS
jgi:hypothetical protein